MGRRPRRRGEGSALSSPGSRRRGGPAGLAPVATPVGGTGGEGDPRRGWAGLAGVGRGSGQALCTWPSAQWPVLLHFCFLFFFFLFLYYFHLNFILF